jgi:hypothetical protein
MRLGMGASQRSPMCGSSAASRSPRSLATSASSMTGALPGVFISYAEGSKAYCILDPETQRVCTARDVVFNEGRGWAWDKAAEDGSTPTYDDFTIDYVHFEGAGGVGSSSSPSVPTSVPEPPLTPAPATPAAPRSPATTPAATSSSRTPLSPVTPRTPAPPATPPGMTTPTPARVENSPVEFATPLLKRPLIRGD